MRTDAPPSGPRVTRAVRGPSEEVGSPHPITATQSARPARAARFSRRVVPAVRPVRAAPTKPPTAPAPTAVKRPATAASGQSDAPHGMGIHTLLQPHSTARPTVPMRTPASAPSATGERGRELRKTASTSSASTR